MEDILRIERETRKFRLLALLLVAAGIQFSHDEVRFWPGIALAVFYLLYLSLVLFPLIRRVPARWSPYVMLAFDLAFVTGALYVFGVSSPAFVLMPVMVVYYALYLGYAGNLLAATLIAFAYIGIAYSQGADITLGRMLPAQIPLFYLLALFSGRTAQLRRHAERERQELAVVLQTERGARALLEMTGQFGAVFEIAALLGELLRITTKAAACSHAAVRLVEEGSEELGGVAAVFPEGKTSATPGKTMLGGAIALERQSIHQRTTLELLKPEPEQLGPWAVMSPAYILVVPLFSELGPAGTLTLLSKEPHAQLSATQQDLLQSLAQFFARFIATSRAYAANQRQASRVSGELRGAVQQIERKQRRPNNDDAVVGGLLLKPAGQRVSLGEKRIELSAKEFDVLYLLARHAGQPVHLDVLLHEVWGDRELTRSNPVEVTINRLRRKLAEQAEAGDMIQTVRGEGYVLDRQHPVLSGGITKRKDKLTRRPA